MTFFVNDDDRLWQAPQEKGWIRFPTPLRYVILLLLLIGLIVGLWYFLPFSHQSVEKAELPLIRADETPIKIKAEDQDVPGIHHQDKLVYGRIRNDQTTPPTEHILPDPTPPLADLKEPTTALKMVDPYTPEDIDLENIEKNSSESPNSPPPSIDSIEALIEEATPVEKEVLPPLAKKGKVLIQLGSLKSHDLAEAEWLRLSKKHKDVLDGLDLIIQKVDLGEDQGIYYRLRTGLADEKSAKATCATLTDRQVSCLGVR